jgi:hypothetical protein
MNTASRMESTVSATRSRCKTRLIPLLPPVEWKNSRGEGRCEGKGEMQTYCCVATSKRNSSDGHVKGQVQERSRRRGKPTSHSLCKDGSVCRRLANSKTGPRERDDTNAAPLEEENNNAFGQQTVLEEVKGIIHLPLLAGTQGNPLSWSPCSRSAGRLRVSGGQCTATTRSTTCMLLMWSVCRQALCSHVPDIGEETAKTWLDTS